MKIFFRFFLALSFFVVTSSTSWASDFQVKKFEFFQEQILLKENSEESVQFAYDRGVWWTGVLLDAYQKTIEAIESADFVAIQAWSKVREYKPANRLSVPENDAIVVLQDFAKGIVDEEKAKSVYEREVFSAYELRMRTSLRAVKSALNDGFYDMVSYELALAEGYFAIIGGGDLVVENLFDQAVELFLNGDYEELEFVLLELEKELELFKAASLSPKELEQKAAQIRSFLVLVPVEYARGVNGNVVNVPFEVQEALTFLEGAQFAFAEIKVEALALDLEKTREVDERLELLHKYLQEAAQEVQVVDLSKVEEEVEALELLFEAYWPKEWLLDKGVDLEMIYVFFDQIEAAVLEGDYQRAEQDRLTAYAFYDVSLELRLMAFNQALAAEIESYFWSGVDGSSGLASLLKSEAGIEEVKASVALLKKSLKEAQDELGQGNSPLTYIVNAALIVFREGLEALLIVFALIGGMRMKKDNLGYKKPLVLGVLLGLLASILTWFLMQGVIYQFISLGEKLEAIVSLVAIVVLFLITNWFFHDVYWNQWNVGLQKKKFKLIKQTKEGELKEGAKYFGFLMLGLTSVYREGFETVLFLQVLVLDAGVVTVLEGLLVGSLLLMILGYFTFKLQKTLPYLKMLIVTGFLIVGILVIMVGKTIHTMQIVAWIGLTPVEGLMVPYWAGLWFGVFATWETLIAQAAAILFVGGSYLLAEYFQKKKR